MLMNELKTWFKRVDYNRFGLLHYIDIGDICLPVSQRPSSELLVAEGAEFLGGWGLGEGGASPLPSGRLSHHPDRSLEMSER